MNRKGVEMSTGMMVAILIAVIMVAAALAILFVLPSLSESEAYKGYFSTCCVSYNLAGKCGEGAGDPSFQCMVSEKLIASGKLSITELASKIGAAPEACCRT
jgi:hypothetical protein